MKRATSERVVKCGVDGSAVRIPVVDAVELVVYLLRAASPNEQLQSNGKRQRNKMPAIQQLKKKKKKSAYLNGVIGHFFQYEFFACKIEIRLNLFLASWTRTWTVDPKEMVVTPQKPITVTKQDSSYDRRSI
jgi:hypothetical protein